MTYNTIPLPIQTDVTLDVETWLAFTAWIETRGQQLVQQPATAHRTATWTLATIVTDGAPDLLTRREFEVLLGLMAGKSKSAMARDLRIGENTVKTHVRKMFRKLGVRDRASAVHQAHMRGFFRQDA